MATQNQDWLNQFEPVNEPVTNAGALVLPGKPDKPDKPDYPSGYEPDPNKPGSLRPIPGGPADKPSKVLPEGSAQKLTDDINQVDALSRAINGFQDDYAGSMFTSAESLLQGWNSDIGTPGQRNWWADFKASDNIIRNTLFGASLTPGEKSSYEQTTITPSMDPKTIKENLQKRLEIVQAAAQRRYNRLKAAGYNPEEIDAIVGEVPIFGKPPEAEKPPATGGGQEGPVVSVTPEESARIFGEFTGGKPAYDAQGNVVGFDYAEAGNPIYDENGNQLDVGLFGRVTDETLAQPAPSFFGGIARDVGEAITGSERATATTEALPDWTQMPEFNNLLSSGTWKTAFGTAFGGGPQEIAQIVQSSFPGTQVFQDEKGNYILQSPSTGQRYAIKPGFQVSDIPRAIGGILAFTPAGRAATLPGAVGGAALTQAGIEATQAGVGGEFNPREVVMAGVGGAGGKLIEEVIPLAVQGVRRITRGPEVPPIGGVAPEAPPSSPAGAAQPPAGGAAPEVPVPTPTAPRTPSVAEQQGISEEMVSLARQAAGRGPRSSSARAKLRSAVEADPTLIQKAEAIGLELPADVFSANVQLKNLTGLARSQPGSAAEAGWQQTVANSAQQVEQSLAEMGASRNLAGLSDEVFTRLNSNMQSLERQGDKLRKNIPGIQDDKFRQTRVDAPDLREYLQREIDLSGGIQKAPGEVQSLAREFGVGIDDSTVRPTFHRMERLRDQLGDAKRNKGPFADLNDVLRGDLYELVANARVDHVASELGQQAADDLAASNKIFQAMYAARDEMTNLFGRDLDKGIGAQIRSVITQGARGDTTNLRRLMAVIPKDMRADVAFSGILANARSRGAEGGFSFANFRNTYRSIRENEPVYRELARNMTESQRKFLENLNAVSEGISDAERRIILTGRARGGPAAEINAQSLTQKIVEQATRRGVGATIGGGVGYLAGEGMGAMAGAAAMESVMAYLGRGGASNLDRVSEVIGSAAYRDLVNEAAQGRTSIRAINRLANSKPFGLFARTLGLNTQDARRTWIRSALAAGTVAAPEQSAPIQPSAPEGAIMVGPQQ